MCDACNNPSQKVTYANMYNVVFHMNECEREEWVKDTLKKSQMWCLAHMHRTSTNIHRMHAQSVLKNVSDACRVESGSRRIRDDKIMQNRAKRLIHKMLRHTYNPKSGRMFRRCVSEYGVLATEKN